MKYIKGILIITILVIGTADSATAQSTPDSLYSFYSGAYAQLDPAAIASLYTEDALAFNLYRYQAPVTLQGRKEIHHNFTEFFQSFQRRGLQLKLTFKVSSRRKLGDEYLDNGYYKLEAGQRGVVTQTFYGKFATVLRQVNGRWLFRSDATSDMNADEYE